MADIRVSIDRGGTFCDVIAHVEGREPLIFKLLSQDPANYADAPTEGIRRVLETVSGESIPVGQKLDGSRIASCRIGTTVATNALLEHKGERFAFFTTRGFKDVCVIGDQSRPKLFDLNIRKPRALHDKVVEVDERVTIEDFELNPFPLDKNRDLSHDPQLVKTQSGEVVRVLRSPNIEAVRHQLQAVRDQGYTSIAICFLHSQLYPKHEDLVADLAREVGLHHVITSSGTSPVGKLLNRANSASSEAYIYPIVRNYVTNFEAGFSRLPQRLEFMCSDGGLKQSDKFRGNEALLSGPAGGVVGIARSCYDEAEGRPIIGFDMGGTSTDVSRFSGTYDLLNETLIAGRRLTNTMLNISTVAAGGGSILFARNGLLVVGPESAGAHPGPACYRKGGPLTITDANVFLGRISISSFPSVFGENANQPLDGEVVAGKFKEITAEFNQQLETSQQLTPEQVALGFLDVANETMSRPIRNTTEARGYAPESHDLVSFGGAGGQHACAIAEKLGISRILIHKWSSLLSAHGISQAELQYETYEPYTGAFSMEVLPGINDRLAVLRKKVSTELISQGAQEASIQYDESLVLHFSGSDTTLSISKPADEDYGNAFRSEHLREFGFNLEKPIQIQSIKVRGVGSAEARTSEESPSEELAEAKSRRESFTSQAEDHQNVYFGDGWHSAGLFRLEMVTKGTYIAGPALILDSTQTIVVEPGFTAYVLTNHVVLEKTDLDRSAPRNTDTEIINPIQLSVFAHRFMAIAEQMGNTLQRTAISTSIKERLDYSCALFSKEGKLVANAPHIPIHLGSMQMAIQCQHRHWLGKLKPGDVLLTNHPQWGGTHLPDLTVVSPVFIGNEIAFYVASRGHHTDIGGKGITSMMPESKELWEEGIVVKSLKIVSDGVFLEDDVQALFEKAGSYPGCSATRRLADNISDLKAQTAANQRGITLLGRLCEEFTLPVVQKYMNGIQANAEIAIRDFYRRTAKVSPDPLKATDYLDDGSAIVVTITIDPEAGSARYDFTGTSPQTWGNYNMPISIAHSAIIYTLRCLVDMEIPLNEGCLAPVEVNVPRGSILNPSPAVAHCASTLGSQRVIDTILRTFKRAAASQGCASSFGWGMGGKDEATGNITPGFNYGETIGGGVGASPGYHGESATHVHSTNTKMTDPEVIEKRTPVLVRGYHIRENSGGKGKWRGGNGTTREIEARAPLKFSILSDRRVYSPYGMAGGRPGQRGLNLAFKFDEDGVLEPINLGGKAALHLKPGEYMQINTPGGGGWGFDGESSNGCGGEEAEQPQK